MLTMTKRSKRRKKQQGQRPPQQQKKPVHLLDIVMPIFGEFNMAAQALSKAHDAAPPLGPNDYRVIILDNGTPPWVANEGDQRIEPKEMAVPIKEMLRSQDNLFRVDQNMGYPGGVNFCVDKGRSPLIMILTTDVFLEPGAINTMVRALDDPNVGVVGMKLLFPVDRESPHGPPGTIQHAGLAFDIRGKPYHPFIGWSADNPRVNIRREMAAVTGACFMTRRNLWEQIGGLDQRYGLGTFEDIDYCFNVRAAGKRVVFDPAAVGYHLVEMGTCARLGRVEVLIVPSAFV
jgi:GT2 family glycosyltransferase